MFTTGCPVHTPKCYSVRRDGKHGLFMRDERGRLLPGFTGNPRGRPKSLRNEIASKTEDGRQLVEKLWEIAQGNRPGAKVRDELDALKYLADHMFGKAPETVVTTTLESDVTDAASRISADDLRQLAKMKLESMLSPGERIISGQTGQALETPTDAVLVPDTTSES